jgi:hypothetical protein
MGVSVIISWIVGLGVASVLCVLMFNRIHSRWIYRPSRTQVAELLSRSLVGQADRRDLDYFMCVPIKHDPILERVRKDLGSLYGPTAFEVATESEVGPPSWTPAARKRVQTMIDSLRS